VLPHADNLPGSIRVGGLEAGALAGGFVYAVEHIATMAATGEPETGLHVIHATARIILTGSGESASSGRVNAGYAEF
jgi:hypothetical protein